MTPCFGLGWAGGWCHWHPGGQLVHEEERGVVVKGIDWWLCHRLCDLSKLFNLPVPLFPSL